MPCNVELPGEASVETGTYWKPDYSKRRQYKRQDFQDIISKIADPHDF